jgi:hypothetical protein
LCLTFNKEKLLKSQVKNVCPEKPKMKSEDESDDAELDLTSETFNPLKALYSTDVKLPVKNVKRFDNLAIFLSRLKQVDDKTDSEAS